MVVKDLQAEEEARQRTIALEFHGNGAEYFKIWIVNILFTILTLGIYSAWAKVRNNRYFYSSLRLDGHSFSYLAKPWTILKGRLIAIAIFGAYSAAVPFYPMIEYPFTAIIFFAVPWLLIKAITFNHNMSAYRNIRFHFTGGYGEAFIAFLLLPLLNPVLVFLLTPIVLQRISRFLVNNKYYGTSRFDFRATIKDYVKIVLMSIGVFILTAIPMLLLLASIFMYTPILAAYEHTTNWTAAAIAGAGSILVAITFYDTQKTNLYYNSSHLGNHHFQANLKFTEMLTLYTVNIILTIISLGLFLPFAKVRLARYKAEHINFIAHGSLDEFVATENKNITATGEELGGLMDIDIGIT